MPPDELGDDARLNITVRKRPGLLRHDRVKGDLQQDVPEFVGHEHGVGGPEGVDGFSGSSSR
jgi:hypothetical protein